MMTPETPSARQERDQSLLCALQTAVRAKQDHWDALFALVNLGYPGEEPPEQEHLDYCVMELAICAEPDDFRIEDVRQLLSDAKRRSEEPPNHGPMPVVR